METLQIFTVMVARRLYAFVQTCRTVQWTGLSFTEWKSHLAGKKGIKELLLILLGCDYFCGWGSIQNCLWMKCYLDLPPKYSKEQGRLAGAVGGASDY